MNKQYKAKSIAGAERRVRELQKRNAKLLEYLDRSDGEVKALAKLAATGPTFFNPTEIWEAEKLRDEILARMGLNSDGTFRAKTS